MKGKIAKISARLAYDTLVEKQRVIFQFASLLLFIALMLKFIKILPYLKEQVSLNENSFIHIFLAKHQ
jgi:hypothetical protein